MDKKVYIFPDYFSSSVVSKIINNGRENNYYVYRLAKYGKKDETIAFLNYYEEVIRGLKIVRKKEAYLKECKNNMDRLSVSCYMDIEDINYYCGVTLKDHYPEKIILEGTAKGKHGLSQITSERKEKNDSHVDWWLYKDATPWIDFKEV